LNPTNRDLANWASSTNAPEMMTRKIKLTIPALITKKLISIEIPWPQFALQIYSAAKWSDSQNFISSFH
jgi:predicted Zn-dependent protease